MKYNTIILGFFMIIPSCSDNKRDVERMDKNKNSVKVPMEVSDISKITLLPFGPALKPEELSKSGNVFYMGLIATNVYDSSTYSKTYVLPPISRLNYMHIDTSESFICESGERVETLLKPTKYRYRLPDIAQYEAFYMTNFSETYADYSPEFIKNCSNFLYLSYGYLILYEAESRTANIITLYYSSGKDGYSIGRNFYIDKDFNIYLADFSDVGDFEGDGEVKTERIAGKHYIISITPKGDIEIHSYK